MNVVEQTKMSYDPKWSQKEVEETKDGWAQVKPKLEPRVHYTRYCSKDPGLI